MRMNIDENPTRQRIIMLLNRAEHRTVAELSKEMDITPMAVRQHLMALERKGIISYVSQKYGIGRPVFLYSLTEKAKAGFPKAYSVFLRDILSAVEEREGRERVEEIFHMRMERQVEEKSKALIKAKSHSDKVRSLARMLDDEGFVVEMKNKNGMFVIKQFNCMLSDITLDYPQACKYELDFYRGLLGKEVQRTQCQRDGAPCCIYEIPNES